MVVAVFVVRGGGFVVYIVVVVDWGGELGGREYDGVGEGLGAGGLWVVVIYVVNVIVIIITTVIVIVIASMNIFSLFILPDN